MLKKEYQPKIWLITDTHFGHEFLRQLGVRPQNYEKRILTSWKKMVNPMDTVIHLGDLAFKPETPMGQMIPNLPGHKILVLGNHDYGFNRYLKMGFDLVTDKILLTYNGQEIIFSHIPVPMEKWQMCDNPFKAVNIHGHLHGDRHRLQDDCAWYPERPYGKYIDLAPELRGCRVINIEEAIKLAKQDGEPKNIFKEAFKYGEEITQQEAENTINKGLAHPLKSL